MLKNIQLKENGWSSHETKLKGMEEAWPTALEMAEEEDERAQEGQEEAGSLSARLCAHRALCAADLAFAGSSGAKKLHCICDGVVGVWGNQVSSRAPVIGDM